MIQFRDIWNLYHSILHQKAFFVLGFIAFPAEQYPSVFSKSTYLLYHLSLSIYGSNVLIKVTEEK